MSVFVVFMLFGICCFSNVEADPPPLPPIVTTDDGIRISNGGIKEITNGQNVVVKCCVEGGNPVVSKVTITCAGGQTSTDDGTQATLNLRITKVMNEGKCSCGADHVTGAYTMTTEFILKVLYPPSFPPIMTVDGNPIPNGGTLASQAGQKVVVKCSVTGGSPLVRKVAVTCAKYSVSSDGAQASLSLVVDKGMSGKLCSCGANHVTGLYRMTSYINIKVDYKLSFTVNSQSQFVEVMDGDDVTFSCEAEGNRHLELNVRGERSKKDLTLTEVSTDRRGVKSNATNVMTCNDTDTYTCAANDDVRDQTLKSVDVFVKCSPEIVSVEDNKRIHHVDAGADLQIDIPIIGYPEPTEYILNKTNKRSRNEKRDVEEGNADNLPHNATYLRQDPSRGTVVLEMFCLDHRDSGQYAFTIRNGIGDGLVYTFKVIVNSVTRTSIMTKICIYVGIGLGFILLVVLVIVVCRKRRKDKNIHSNVVSSSSPYFDDAGYLEVIDNHEYIEMDQTPHFDTWQDLLPCSTSHINQATRRQRDFGHYDNPDTLVFCVSHEMRGAVAPRPCGTKKGVATNKANIYSNPYDIAPEDDYLEIA